MFAAVKLAKSTRSSTLTCGNRSFSSLSSKKSFTKTQSNQFKFSKPVSISRPARFYAHQVTPQEVERMTFSEAYRFPEKDEIISNDRMEGKPYSLKLHRSETGFIDWAARIVVKSLRIPADLFFGKRYGHRAIVLETVAAVPGMVGAVFRHLRSLRRMQHDGGWIHEMLEEAENERMHLLTFIKLQQPNIIERALVMAVQLVFFSVFFLAYLVSPRLCHRIVGYLEEEAVISYTQYLNMIDAGKVENVAAPKIAIDYWKLPADARLRDVVLAVRADEARHRDVNHRFADVILSGERPNLHHHIPLKQTQH